MKQIRDLSRVLKDLEPFVKDPKFLRVGRNFTNFSLRPREVLANLLVCVAIKFETGKDLTFAEDSTGGDGVILDRATKEFVYMEHVFIPEPTQEKRNVEDVMVAAIAKKAAYGQAYAKGKHLVVFSEAIGWWYPNRVARRISGTHFFESVWTVALFKMDSSGYLYSVSRLDLPSPVWTIQIPDDFSSWTVIRQQ